MRRLVLAVGFVWVGFIGWSAVAEGVTADTVQRLGAASYTTRLAETERLMHDFGVTPEALAALIVQARAGAGGEAGGEVAARAERALRHRLLAQYRKELSQPGQRGSLGIQHRQVLLSVPGGGLEATAAVLVTHVLPGFPAAGQLRVGDLILRFNDAGVPGVGEAPEAFGRVIQARQLGERVQMEVLRDGSVVSLTLELAGSPALQRMYARDVRRPSGLAEDVARWLDRQMETLVTAARVEAAAGG